MIAWPVSVRNPDPLFSQILVFDAPGVDEFGLRRIVQIDHVHPLLAVLAEDFAPHIDVGARELLLDLDVGDTERCSQGEVRHHGDVVAAGLVGGPLLGGAAGGSQGQASDDEADRESTGHRVAPVLGVVGGARS